MVPLHGPSGLTPPSAVMRGVRSIRLNTWHDIQRIVVSPQRPVRALLLELQYEGHRFSLIRFFSSPGVPSVRP